MKMEVTSDTELRELIRDFPSVSNDLSLILDMNAAWRILAERIPTRRNDARPLYNMHDIRNMERSEGGSTKALLHDWSTHGLKDERPTIHDVINQLCKCELYRAAEYLAVNVLEGDPVERNLPPTTIELNRLEFIDLPFAHKHPSSLKVGYNEIVEGYITSSVVPDLPFKYGIPQAETLPEIQECNDSGSHIQDIDGDEKYHSNRKSPPVDATSKSSNQNYFSLVLPECSLFRYPFREVEAMTLGFDDSRRVGSGAFSTVFLGNKLNGTSQNVAVKKMDIKFTKQFVTEVKVLSSFQHRFILQLMGYSVDDSNWYLVYEYVVNGTLQDRLACVNNTPVLPWRTRVHIAVDTAFALVSLHTHGFVHRDVKSANILLDQDFRAKLGDFGIAHVAPEPGKTSTDTQVAIGTKVYMPNEAFYGMVSLEWDTYSFGVVLLEILTGRKPFCRENMQDLVSFKLEFIDVNGINQYLDPNGGDWDLSMANDLFELSKKCLKDILRQRPSMYYIYDELNKIVKNHLHQDLTNSDLE